VNAVFAALRVIEEHDGVRGRTPNDVIVARADLDPVWLPQLKRSGCYSLTVGFESRSLRTLAAMRKGVDPATMEKFARAAADAGIRIHGCFILGWPGETARETRARNSGVSLSQNRQRLKALRIMNGTLWRSKRSVIPRATPATRSRRSQTKRPTRKGRLGRR